MTLKSITPAEAAKLIGQGAVLVDIREADEHARERIPGALSRPLSAIGATSGAAAAASSLTRPGTTAVLFHCKSGMRTKGNADRLRATCTDADAYIVEGGLDAWKAAGLATEADRSKPIEIIRQVQITAGSLVLLGVVLGWLVDPRFYGLSGFIGAGLVFAGVSGTCGMAHILQLMPWNRSMAAAGAAAK